MQNEINNAVMDNVKVRSQRPEIFPDLMTEEELIIFLRIPQISNSEDYHNVIENLKRMHGLPRIHICGKALYPREAIVEWIRTKTIAAK
ncbi:MAG: hypothetical protein A2Y10_05900 [Planctomycetes bacterium GWF2_41_51]|nr:MAG: hypothetical protein A2Y10_05900 [Planctomycetes bacterium GWF2_41_51]